MKVCIPTNEDKGKESVAFSHFGSAPLFLLVDTDTGAIEKIDNSDSHHEHGMCHPMAALDNRVVDAVLVGGIGRRALMGLNAAGIKVFKSEELTVTELVGKINAGDLCEMTPDSACGGHHGCH